MSRDELAHEMLLARLSGERLKDIAERHQLRPSVAGRMIDRAYRIMKMQAAQSQERDWRSWRLSDCYQLSSRARLLKSHGYETIGDVIAAKESGALDLNAIVRGDKVFPYFGPAAATELMAFLDSLIAGSSEELTDERGASVGGGRN